MPARAGRQARTSCYQHMCQIARPPVCCSAPRRRLGHQPGVDALEPLTGHNTAMKEKQQTVRQSRQAAELEQAEEQGEEVVEEPQAAVEEPQAAVEEPQAAVEEPQAAVEEPQALATEAVAEEEAAAR